MGIDLLVLDAGWFGNPQKGADWTRQRGDWDQVNRLRFPHGLKWLAQQIHAMGMKVASGWSQKAWARKAA